MRIPIVGWIKCDAGYIWVASPFKGGGKGEAYSRRSVRVVPNPLTSSPLPLARGEATKVTVNALNYLRFEGAETADASVCQIFAMRTRCYRLMSDAWQ